MVLSQLEADDGFAVDSIGRVRVNCIGKFEEPLGSIKLS